MGMTGFDTWIHVASHMHVEAV